MARIGRNKRSISHEDFVRTGPGTLAGRFLRSFWQPICLSNEIEPGRARRLKIMGENLTAYRSANGRVHLVADRCPHRGTQLSVGWVEGDCIRCFYHGWKFDGDGRCVEQPAEKESFAAKIHIAAYPVRDYCGLVFAYLGEDEAPEFPRYPELEDESGGTLIPRAVRIPCNYFQSVENMVDQVHVAFAHRDVYTAAGMHEVPNYRVEETEYGICASGERGVGERRTHFHMPNVNVLMIPPRSDSIGWGLLVNWRVPIDDENFLQINVRRYELAPGATQPSIESFQQQVDVALAILAGGERIESVTDRNYKVQVQDNIAQIGQGAICDRSLEHLGKSDTGVILLRKLWREELEAIAEGRPRRPWRRTEEKLIIKSGAPEEQPA